MASQEGDDFAAHTGFGLTGERPTVDVDGAFGGYDVGLASAVDASDVDRWSTQSGMCGPRSQFGRVLRFECEDDTSHGSHCIFAPVWGGPMG